MGKQGLLDCTIGGHFKTAAWWVVWEVSELLGEVAECQVAQLLGGWVVCKGGAWWVDGASDSFGE